MIERLGIGPHGELVGDGDLDRDVALCRLGLDRAQRLLDDGSDRHAAELEAVLAGVEPRQVEQVGEDAGEPLGVAVQAVDQPAGNRRVVLGAGHQRLGVGADHGDRRAQLVRDVGDEVAPHGLEPAHRGDVLEQQHAAVAAPLARGADQRARRVGQLDLGGRRHVAVDQIEQLGDADEVDQRLADRRAGDAEHPARGVVEQLDPVLAVDRDHALGQAFGDRGEQHALARERAVAAVGVVGEEVDPLGELAQLVAGGAVGDDPRALGSRTTSRIALVTRRVEPRRLAATDQPTAIAIANAAIAIGATSDAVRGVQRPRPRRCRRRARPGVRGRASRRRTRWIKRSPRRAGP